MAEAGTRLQRTTSTGSRVRRAAALGLVPSRGEERGGAPQPPGDPPRRGGGGGTPPRAPPPGPPGGPGVGAGRPSAAAATPWSVNGPWKLDQAVTDPDVASQAQITPNPSTGVHDERGCRNRRRTTRSAPASAEATSP